MIAPVRRGRPCWHMPARRVLVYVAAVYAFVGIRLLLVPTVISGGPAFGALFLAAAVAIVAHALWPLDRQIRAAAGALSTVAPAGRSIVLVLEAIAPGNLQQADPWIAASAWSLVAALMLYTWARVQPPPPAR